MALFSAYLIWKSTELSIGWEPGEGPGGGAFPFWLAVGMLITSILIFARNLLNLSVESRSTEIFMHAESVRLFFVVLFSLSAMIGMIHVAGVYVSLPLFMVFYVRYIGKHSWRMVLYIGILTPLSIFVLFEKILVILLPKGITDTQFYIFF